MYRKLNLDRDKVDACRALVERALSPVYRFVEQHSTVSIEAASLQLAGIAQPDKVVAALSREQLKKGVWSWVLRIMHAEKVDAKTACERLQHKKLNLERLPESNPAELAALAANVLEQVRYQLEVSAAVKQALVRRYNGHRKPLKALSLLFISPQNVAALVQEALEFNGPMLDQLNCVFTDLAEHEALQVIKQLRQLADDYGRKENRFIRMGFSNSLLSCTQAAAAVEHRLETLRADLQYDILQNNMHPRFAVIEHAFIRGLAAKSEMNIESKDADALARMDGYRYGHQSIGTMVMSDAFARHYGLGSEHVSLTQAFVLAPDVEDGWLFELAQSQLLREFFLKNPLVLRCDHFHQERSGLFYQGDIVLSELFGFISEQTMLEFHAAQHLQSGVMQQLKRVDHFNKVLRTVGDELVMSSNGKMARRAHTMLENLEKQLQKVEQVGFFEAVEQRILHGNTALPAEQLFGAQLYFQKDRSYYNPVWDFLKPSREED